MASPRLWARSILAPTVIGGRESVKGRSRGRKVTGWRLMSLSRLGELLVFGDALGFKLLLLLRLGGGYAHRAGIQPLPATRRSAIATASDFLAAALTDNSASLPLASATESSMVMRLTCLK